MDTPGGIDGRTEEDARYRLLIDAIHDYAIYMLDPKGLVISWNPGAQRFKGYRDYEILGRNFACFYTADEQAEGLPARNLEIAARAGRFEGEGWRVRSDGGRFWAHVVIDAIRGDQGELIGFAKITRDITEQRQTQLALEQAQHALFQSQKMDSIGQLTGGVAHDFNNLLMAIMGSLELVRRRMPDADPRVAALLDNAAQGAERGAQLTRRMLAFARRQDLKPESLDLAALVRGMAGLLERSIGPGVDIRTEVSGPPSRVRSDAHQLETALLNLVVNARDAMPDGGRITVAVRGEGLAAGNALGLAAGAYACLTVTDTGHGMDEQTLARAIEPFFTTKGVGRGAGLGLPMVHGLAEQSGGRLRLASRPGMGAVAEIWLPAEIAPPEAPAQDVDAAPERTPVKGGLAILAVDDDELVRMNTRAMLEDLGHRVIEATSAAQALTILDADPTIDMMVTDHAMPGMTGQRLAEVARIARPGLPIVLATGYAVLEPVAEPDLERLPKPFNLSQLARALDQAAARRS